MTTAPAAKQLGWLSGSVANGKWRQGPDGAIDQSGEVTLVNGAATIILPKPFPNACDWVGLVAVLTSTALTNCSVYLTAEPSLSSIGIGGTTTTLGVSATISAGTFKVRWKASGS